MDESARFRADLVRALGEEPRGVLGLAVSGGPDSMAMLALAAEALDGRIAVATVDHGLRPEAVEEAALVADACARLGVLHATLTPDAAIAGASFQARAREVRYALLARSSARRQSSTGRTTVILAIVARARTPTSPASPDPRPARIRKVSA